MTERVCKACDGSGKLPNPFPGHGDLVKCWACNGTGRR